jgi:hypothetical protein
MITFLQRRHMSGRPRSSRLACILTTLLPHCCTRNCSRDGPAPAPKSPSTLLEVPSVPTRHLSSLVPHPVLSSPPRPSPAKERHARASFSSSKRSCHRSDMCVQPKKVVERRYAAKDAAYAARAAAAEPVDQSNPAAVQRAQEEAEMQLMTEQLGGGAAVSLSPLTPKTKAEFEEYALQVAKEHVDVLKGSKHYKTFVKSLAKELCSHLDKDSIKDVETALAGLRSEMVKAERQALAEARKGALSTCLYACGDVSSLRVGGILACPMKAAQNVLPSLSLSAMTRGCGSVSVSVRASAHLRTMCGQVRFTTRMSVARPPVARNGVGTSLVVGLDALVVHPVLPPGRCTTSASTRTSSLP